MDKMELKTKLFEDLVVVELAGVLAGPAVGLFFAELGAKVTKIENSRTKGDITRHWKQQNEDTNAKDSAYFASVNWNKEHVFLDLREKEDKKAALELISKADVLIANFKKSSAIKLGFDYQTLSVSNPKLIYAQIDGFPNEDNRPAFDVVLQAETSYLSMSGTKKGEHTKMPVALIDILTAHQLKEGILIALMNRSKTGEGAFVSTSLYETAISSLANQASNYLNNKNIAKPLGTEHPNISPYGDLFICKDKKKITLAIGTEAQYKKLASTMNIEEISKEQFKENTDRIEFRSELQELLQDIIKEKSSMEWAKIFKENGIPFGVIKTIDEVLDSAFVKNNMLLSDLNGQGKEMKRVKSISFKIK